MREAALEYLNRDHLQNMDIIECINRGIAGILYAGDEGVLIDIPGSDICMLSFDDAEAALKQLHGKEYLLCVMHQMPMKEKAAALLGMKYGEECYQFVYEKGEHFELSGYDIRTLDPSYSKIVSDNYEMAYEPEIRDMLKAGRIRGIFVDGIFAGFAGIHPEGAMGMLEIFEGYRRQGLGEALEKDAINRCLQEGYTPYCQVFESNVASVKMQRKLGLSEAGGRICWMWNEDKLKEAELSSGEQNFS